MPENVPENVAENVPAPDTAPDTVTDTVTENVAAPGSGAGGLPVTRGSIVGHLRDLGVRPGQTLLVHASLRSLGWVCGGATAVVQALLDALGPDGTLVVPTFTPDNRDPQRWRDPAVPEQWWSTIRDTLPAFDVRLSPGQRMGAISEQVRTWPGARRSDHPHTSFAALGPHADRIVAGHELTCHLGERSPLRRLEDLDARVLLLGVGWNRCTAFHLAEYRRPDPPRRRYSAVVLTPGGDRTWTTFEDVDLDDSDFQPLGLAFERTGATRAAPPLRSVIGRAAPRLFPIEAATRFARQWLLAHRSAR